jgi:hypothetical protein
VKTKSGQRKSSKDDPNASKNKKSTKKWCMHPSNSVSWYLLALCLGQSLCWQAL